MHTSLSLLVGRSPTHLFSDVAHFLHRGGTLSIFVDFDWLTNDLLRFKTNRGGHW